VPAAPPVQVLKSARARSGVARAQAASSAEECLFMSWPFTGPVGLKMRTRSGMRGSEAGFGTGKQSAEGSTGLATKTHAGTARDDGARGWRSNAGSSEIRTNEFMLHFVWPHVRMHERDVVVRLLWQRKSRSDDRKNHSCSKVKAFGHQALNRDESMDLLACAGGGPWRCRCRR